MSTEHIRGQEIMEPAHDHELNAELEPDANANDGFGLRCKVLLLRGRNSSGAILSPFK